MDEALCGRVRRYLNAYMDRYAVTHASVEVAATRGIGPTLPNSRGMSARGRMDGFGSPLTTSRPTMSLLQLGGIAYPDETMPTGSVLSVGNEYLQIDVGFREHWWSPMTDSSMLIGTQAETMPGVTLSNYMPIPKLGFRYEAFMARMAASMTSHSTDRTTSGYPRLAGLHVSIEPMRGWSLSASRLLQYGGGERDDSLSGLFDALLPAHALRQHQRRLSDRP